jgi:uncharacterized cofD-like protein
MEKKSPRIVVVGGGSGSAVALNGLVNCKVSISAIVTMFDSGGSSGLLRKEFGLLPLGDIRQCLLALSSKEYASVRGMINVLNYRFESESSLMGHSVGNLVLAALTSIHKDLKKAIEELSALLRVKGHVLPVTYDQANLCARLENGDIIYTESDIDLRSDSIPPIETVYLDHAVKVNQEAVNAIDSADLVLLGPGDLYTSIIPNFLVPEIKNAISSTRACVVYAGNLMTKRGETSGYKASKFVSEVCRYSGRETLDYLILNNATLSDEVKFAYKKEQAEPVIIDDEVSNYANNVIIKDLVKLEGTTVRHDPKLLTDEIMAFIELCSNTITE